MSGTLAVDYRSRLLAIDVSSAPPLRYVAFVTKLRGAV